MSRRLSSGSPKLRFMKDQEFEDETILLLAEYGGKHGPELSPPIPIDEIVELYLKLQLEFKDMQHEFGVDDVHGALWVNERRVGIDQRLDPTNSPSMLGRYHFTLAHEAGHWRLHRHLFQRSANQLGLLPQGVVRPEYICRSSDTAPIEYQANRFASCLLMPREVVKRAWHEWRGDMEPIYADDLAAAFGWKPFTSLDDPNAKLLMDAAVLPLAERFEVSGEAMRIRLQGLRLLLPRKEGLLF
jgi:hypothetical protein